ncbi:nocturnin [Pelodytes ibericus]
MYHGSAGRLCSALRDVPALCATSLRQQPQHSPVRRRALSPPVLGSLASFACCHNLAGWIGEGPVKAVSASGPVTTTAPTTGAPVSATRTASRTVCSMGNSTSRLYSALAKTLSSSTTVSQHQEYLHESDQEQLDPKDLMEECQVALQDRPARLHRELVSLHNPSSNQTFRVMQWNILAQALGEGKDNFVKCPMEALKWEERKYLILEEILTYHPDVLCLQEVDHYFDTFQPILSRLGYQCTFLAKPWSPCLDVEHNNGPDGCALFFLQERFQLVSSAKIRLSARTLKTNQVAIAETLQCNETGKLLCFAVTHLKARTGWERFRLAQGSDLLRNLESITQGAKIPLIICGDFNAEPTEEVYKRFASSSLNLNSAYKVLSEDGESEPPYTTWKIRPTGESCNTLDYIWYSQHALKVNSALGLLTEEQIGPNRLPSFNYPSDHLSLVCDFSFNQEYNHL